MFLVALPLGTGADVELPIYMRALHMNLHPLLQFDADYVHLDLAPLAFAPLTLSAISTQGLVPLREEVLIEAATCPPQSMIYLYCGRLGADWAGRWRVRIGMWRTVSVGDVLSAAHAMLQMQITHAEWAKCTRDEMYTASRAYTRRVRKESYDGAVEGVRRVDFLGEEHYFAGVKKVKDDEFELLVRARAK